ncbi:MAG: hypothetical protein V3T30_08895 [Thermodesulfobacteriota bacterium]
MAETKKDNSGNDLIKYATKLIDALNKLIPQLLKLKGKSGDIIDQAEKFKFIDPDQSKAGKEFFKNKEYLIDALAGSAKGIGGVAKVFTETLAKSVYDMDADYSKVVDSWQSGIDKVATDLAPTFSKLFGEDKDKAEQAIPEVMKKPANESSSADAVTGTCCCAATAAGATSEGAPGASIGAAGAGATAGQGGLEATHESVKEQDVLEKKTGSQKVTEFADTWSKKAEIAGNAVGSISSTLQNLYKTTGSKNKTMFKAMKGFAIAETVIQTARAAMGAYAALSKIEVIGPALGVAAAGAAIAAGVARVNTIRNTKPGDATGTISAGGTAQPAYKGGSANAYPVPERQEEAKPTQNVTVVIHNPLSQQNWAELVENEVIPAINDATENRNLQLTVETVA